MTSGMMMKGAARVLAVAILAMLPALPSQAAAATVAATATAPEADRRAILAMAGDYKVKFDYRETVAFVPGYTLVPPKVQGGHEVIRVIADAGDHIMLQHLLVVSAPVDKKGPTTIKTMVIKHWRQDWTWQPQSLLVYKGASKWASDPVTPANAAGCWSQTVWQTDDSPRYGGIGRWTHVNGVDSWTSTPTWRPLARRDATRHPVYDRYYGINRHALTPTGWVHQQDNAKLASQGGKLVTIADELVVNTYNRDGDFDVAAADDYWAKTAGYWAGVRTAWDASLASGKPLTVTEVADTGSATGEKLMGWADDLAAGKLARDDADRQALALILSLSPTGLAAR